jgi:diguanylate cyclase (GGDEF)-like protein
MHLVTRYIPEFDWYLFVEQPEEQAISSIRRTLMINLGVCAVVTVIVLLLTNLSISSYQRRLEKMATTDALTGISNRRAFDIIIRQTLKQVNDTFGHIVGDAVLQHVVRLTQANIRASDVLCRWGGEEFLVLLQDCSLLDAHAMAEKSRRVVRAEPLVHDGQRIEATISLGVAEYREGEVADHLFSRVDQALYRAKQTGRDRSEMESPPLPPG